MQMSSNHSIPGIDCIGLVNNDMTSGGMAGKITEVNVGEKR